MPNGLDFINNWLEKTKKETELDPLILELLENNLIGINNLELNESCLLNELKDTSKEETEDDCN